LTLYSNLTTGAITGGAQVALGGNGTDTKLTIAKNSGVSQISSLSIPSGSVLDITNNKLLINYGSGTDPIASIEQWIKNGYEGLSSAAIISSAIAADDAASGLSYGIGYADSADPGNPAGLAPDTIEIMFTLLGDANLDGTVNSEDFTLFSEHLGQSGQTWDDGDFNYDGTVNTEDFTLFSQNLGQSASLAAEAGVLEEANGGINLANVPEPACAGLMAMTGLAVLRRRTFRRSDQGRVETF
jgi:Dockerin type I domain